MRAVVYTEFGGLPELREVDEPEADSHDAVIKVEATGVCRSDWHGWMGHDPDIRLPHVPGHEFSGTVASVGSAVKRWRAGDRVTVPFVCACGTCDACLAGDHQVCEHQTQPGFTHDGSFAEYVRIDHADTNLVRLPDSVDFVSAAALGCRFATAFRAVREHGRVHQGQWVAVHGCGGVGLSAVMIATMLGAKVIAVDVSPGALDLARDLGAVATLDATTVHDVGTAVINLTDGGAHV
jgi:D-arabinose 1-dehydrogenase-like Zn-dependent alcohol dehydrogenase